MAVSNDLAAMRAARHAAVTDDNFPACPRCGNLCGRLAIVCADCGARLKPTENDLRDAADHGKVSRNAAPPREDTSPTEGMEA